MSSLSSPEKYNRWIEETKAKGILTADDPFSITEAYQSAVKVVREARDESGFPSEGIMAETGVKYVTSFMVSCALNGSGDTLPLLNSGSKLQDVFAIEAERNASNMLGHTLNEATIGHPDILWSQIVAAGCVAQIAPTELGRETAQDEPPKAVERRAEHE